MFPYASERIKADFNIALKAVSIDGRNLEDVSEELKNNKEIVKNAVKKYGFCVKYASLEMKKDKEIVSIAIENCGNGDNLKFVDDIFFWDREIVLKAVKNGLSLSEIFHFCDDREIVIESIKYDGDNYEFVSDELTMDKEIIYYACNDKYFDTSLIPYYAVPENVQLLEIDDLLIYLKYFIGNKMNYIENIKNDKIKYYDLSFNYL